MSISKRQIVRLLIGGKESFLGGSPRRAACRLAERDLDHGR